MADLSHSILLWIPIFLFLMVVDRIEIHVGLPGGDAPVRDITAPVQHDLARMEGGRLIPHEAVAPLREHRRPMQDISEVDIHLILFVVAYMVVLVWGFSYLMGFWTSER